jgi:hypothetical protein
VIGGVFGRSACSGRDRFGMAAAEREGADAAAAASMGEAGRRRASTKERTMEKQLSMDDLSQANGGRGNATPDYSGVHWDSLVNSLVAFGKAAYTWDNADLAQGVIEGERFFGSYPNPTPEPGDVTDPLSGVWVGHDSTSDQDNNSGANRRFT